MHAESSASREQVSLYTQGRCHVFAAALHRITGWKMLLALDYGEPFWTDPCDEENFIPAVVHVYCLDDEGRCWDVRGARSETIAASEIADWLPNVTDTILEMVADEEELRTYVGCWGEDAEGNQIERPLREYDEDDLEQALLDVKLALRNTTGFPAFDVALRIVGGFR